MACTTTLGVSVLHTQARQALLQRQLRQRQPQRQRRRQRRRQPLLRRLRPRINTLDEMMYSTVFGIEVRVERLCCSGLCSGGSRIRVS